MSEHGVMTTPIFDELRDEIGIELADARPADADEAAGTEEVRAAG